MHMHLKQVLNGIVCILMVCMTVMFTADNETGRLESIFPVPGSAPRGPQLARLSCQTKFGPDTPMLLEASDPGTLLRAARQLDAYSAASAGCLSVFDTIELILTEREAVPHPVGRVCCRRFEWHPILIYCA